MAEILGAMLAAFLASLYFSGKGGSKWFSDDENPKDDEKGLEHRDENTITTLDVFCNEKRITRQEFQSNQAKWQSEYRSWRNERIKKHKAEAKNLISGQPIGKSTKVSSYDKFNSFLKDKDLTMNEFKKHPDVWLKEYDIWKKENK